jgi:molybdopterin molybdotransferase
MLTVAEARAQILARLSPLGGERVALLEARGRVLAEDVIAGRALPPWDNSAMDGYAVRSADAAPGRTLAVVSTIAAGQLAGRALEAGEAARIMTGAPMPAGADAVIMQEETDLGATTPGHVRLDAGARPGQHVRRRGEDVREGERVLAAGALVGPGEIGLLAALGRSQLTVVRAARVAIVSTGDELCDLDEPPGPGRIVNSNAHALAAQVAELGAIPVLLPTAKDCREDIAATLAAALAHDVVISSGGVSVGEFDFVKQAMSDVGLEMGFWKVAMRPGKPVAFGVSDLAGRLRPVLGLPGNPASSMVSFELFVRPVLRRLAGHAEADDRRRERVALGSAYRKEPGRAHYVRARLVAGPTPDAPRVAELLARQGSGMLMSMIHVGALLELPIETGDLPAGAIVTAIVLG